MPPQRTGKQIIEAIHEDNIEDFLQKIGLLESLKNGELHCASCDCTITKENIQCFFLWGQNWVLLWKFCLLWETNRKN